MRSKQRLNATLVEKLRAPTATGKPEIVWDGDLKGFGVLLSGTTKTKSYIVRVSIKGHNNRPRIVLAGPRAAGRWTRFPLDTRCTL